MKQWKRLTSVLLVLGIVLGLMPLSAFAAEPENTVENTITVTEPDNGGEDTYTFTLLGDGTVELTKFSTTATVADAVIPSTVQGHPVTSIGDDAFAYNYQLKTVTLPDSVTSVGAASFNECMNLEEVNLGNSVVSIGMNAFVHCRSMVKLTIPQSIQVIKYGAFDYGPFNNTKLQELYYTGTKAQWEELMKKKISHEDDGHDYTEEIGKMNPMLTEIDQKNFYCAHTVSFDCGDQAKGSTQVVQYGGTVVQPADPKADGYRFEGWYTQKKRR